MAASGEVTQLLIEYGAGRREALDVLLPLVYDELRHIAANYLNRERAGHTLQPTALVHEAYLRLVNQHSVDWHNRAQFYGLAAEMMRRILVNHAEKKRAEKRGSGGAQVPIDEATVAVGELDFDLLALDEALKQLTQLDEIKARIVELKFFGGLKTEEIAEVVGKSTRTVEREWMLARGWLFKTLSDTKANEESRLGKAE